MSKASRRFKSNTQGLVSVEGVCVDYHHPALLCQTSLSGDLTGSGASDGEFAHFAHEMDVIFQHKNSKPTENQGPHLLV